MLAHIPHGSVIPLQLQLMKKEVFFCGSIKEFIGSSGHPQGIFNCLNSNEDKHSALIAAWKHS